MEDLKINLLTADEEHEDKNKGKWLKHFVVKRLESFKGGEWVVGEIEREGGRNELGNNNMQLNVKGLKEKISAFVSSLLFYGYYCDSFRNQNFLGYIIIFHFLFILFH